MANGEPVDSGVAIPTDKPILLFDGVCNLCNGFVQWVIERDPEARFRFAALQSEAGQQLLERHGLPTERFETFVLIEGEDYYTKSTAALRMLKRLGFPYSLLYPFVAVPRSIRDRVYEFVAANRYDWFGQRDRCLVPPSDLEDRFIDGDAR
ncbi:thiol-disulfide oxidoreductase DCC family protein [Natronomonas halophila]|uniref:thiol-disulfide oxidoreductase DCC family protein n=1 Tax=Natronomonas halophila TaxID=2747817 RepID=UPI0015B3B0B2|nr:thiol-disulfide oxidoreductase DCC family protein [Natronomonas halophila]QLD84973.1 thiol-disulfide oxidoreductase DCC family protein [Natronomonas halophila]